MSTPVLVAILRRVRVALAYSLGKESHRDRLIAVSLLVAMGCVGRSHTAVIATEALPNSGATLTWREQVHTISGCDPAWDESFETLLCPFVRLRYPEIRLQSAGSSADGANGWVTGLLNEHLYVEGWRDSISAAGQRFLSAYTEFEREHPGKGAWYLDASIRVLYETPRVLSLEAVVAAYEGANHANVWRWLASFATDTGARLRLVDLVGITGIDEVRRRAEKQFRKLKHLPPERRFIDTVYHFPDDEFYLPENFAIGPDGVIFYFNQYEIAAWAEGPTELVLPHVALADYR